jgi:hypothetical protein
VKRPLVLAAVWLACAAAAVGVGFLAVSLVDASASPGAQPPLPTVATGATTTSPAAAPAGGRTTPGGTVYATCTDGTAQLGAAPAAGWTVENSPGRVEFGDGTQKIEVRADCSTGSPVYAVEGPVADDGGGGSPAPATTTSGTTADDHGGDRRGGSGGGSGADD